MSRKTIAVLGATGNLGKLIAQHLASDPHVSLRVLVRPGSLGKLHDFADAEIRDIDVTSASPDELAAALDGAACVVSAIQGGPEIIVDAQGRVLDAARRAGVRRFIPSTFSYDFLGLKPGENFMTDQRREFAELADEKRGPVEVVHILIGCFMDKGILGFIGALDVDNARSRLWGEGKEPMDFTTYDDTAAFTAAVAVDERARPRILGFAGSTLGYWDFIETFERETGRKVDVARMGSLADLSTEIDHRVSTDPTDFMAYIPLMYWRAMLNGAGKLKTLSNADYPSIKPTTFDVYVNRTVR